MAIEWVMELEWSEDINKVDVTIVADRMERSPISCRARNAWNRLAKENLLADEWRSRR